MQRYCIRDTRHKLKSIAKNKTKRIQMIALVGQGANSPLVVAYWKFGSEGDVKFRKPLMCRFLTSKFLLLSPILK